MNECALTESEDGYYFARDNIVYFIDKNDMECSVLCNRPNCEHGEKGYNPDCSAYFLNDISGIPWLTRYGDYLYVLRTTATSPARPELIRTTLTGEQRKSICIFESTIVDSALIHRGNLYAVLGVYDESLIQHWTIHQADIEGGSKPKELLRLEPDERIGNFTAYGDWLYYIRIVQDQTGNTLSRYLERCDICTGKVQGIDPDTGASADDDWRSTGILFVDGKLYVIKTNYSAIVPDDPLKPPTETLRRIYSCGLDGSKPQLCMEKEGIFSTDGQYIYSFRLYGSENESADITVFDADGKELDRFELADLPEGMNSSSFTFPKARSGLAICSRF